MLVVIAICSHLAGICQDEAAFKPVYHVGTPFACNMAGMQYAAQHQLVPEDKDKYLRFSCRERKTDENR